MRLLAGVSADVNSQGAALDEALAATGNRARVGALVGVDSVMALKIRLAVEALLGEESLALKEVVSSSIDGRAYLVARVPVALEGTGGRLIFDEFEELHCE